MCFGHTHKPYHRTIHDPENKSIKVRHAINIGSVGKPNDGDPRGCYVIIDFKDISSIMLQEPLQVEFVRFEYDIEMAAKAVENSRLPNDYAESLRKAF